MMGSTSEALVATAVGILVAIPAVVAFNLFNRLMRSHLSHSDALAHAILCAMHSIQGSEKGADSGAPQAQRSAKRKPTSEAESTNAKKPKKEDES